MKVFTLSWIIGFQSAIPGFTAGDFLYVAIAGTGHLLQQAKERLPHGEYLPWVQQACGLKPRYAQQLVQAAEWVNAQSIAHLDGVTDITTLFILSADTTPEDVREWFMERCAAGDVPNRAEVQERKRSHAAHWGAEVDQSCRLRIKCAACSAFGVQSAVVSHRAGSVA